MKLSLLSVSALLLVSSASFACPDFSGTYKSKLDPNMTQTISQSVENGSTVYILGEGAAPLIADGQQHTTGPATYTATCSGNSSLNFTVTAEGVTTAVSLVKTTEGYSSSAMGITEEFVKQP